MKTTYEWVANERFGLNIAIKDIRKLLELSKEMPWLLDPRIKFKFDFIPGSGPYKGFFIQGYPKGTFIKIRIPVYLDDFTEKELKSPFLFRKKATKSYHLKSGWMVIENCS